MKINYTWLTELVDINRKPADLATKLTMAGLAVDSIEKHSVAPFDDVFEFDLTSNRPDCLSHFGIAREVAAIEGTVAKLPTFELKQATTEASIVASVEINDFNLCPRYSARVIRGVKVGPSPSWLVSRLESVGVRSINNVADITNYVLFELGHPLHAFDLDRLGGAKIIVRRARLGEKLVTLDGVERDLGTHMLVIADDSCPTALAGIMGGADSEIRAETTNVLLESAYFLPSSVRQTARALGMNTEASYRFERGTDYEMVVRANDRAAALIAELAGGEVLDGVIDVKVPLTAPQPIEFRTSRYKALTGLPVRLERAARILTSLGLQVDIDTSGRSLRAVSPSWRYDLAREEDLIEEVVRIDGYDRLKLTIPGGASAGAYLIGEQDRRLVRRTLSGFGFHEAMNFSFVNAGSDHLLSPSSVVTKLVLTNPIDETQAQMRTTLLPGLLESVGRNLNHGTKNVRLFELGKCYEDAEGERPIETEALGIVLTGMRNELDWTSVRADFLDLKGAIEALFENLARKTPRFTHTEDIRYLHPGRAAVISLNGRNAGLIGQLHPRVATEFKFKQEVFVAELDFSLILASEKVESRYRALPRFPAVIRDLSILVDDVVTFGEIEESILDLGITELIGVKLFDVYTGKELPAGKRALALSFRYRSETRTLTEAEVNSSHGRVIDEVVRRFKAEVR
jgi:phenylalanyl-tRNA synthetase beta chain